jgi:hypothetical protein
MYLLLMMYGYLIDLVDDVQYVHANGINDTDVRRAHLLRQIPISLTDEMQQLENVSNRKRRLGVSILDGSSFPYFVHH